MPHSSKPKSNASPSTFPEYSWKLIHPNARLEYYQKPQDCDQALAKLPPGDYGFDMEWKPTFVKGGKENPVALIQIASADFILLIQISAMKELPPRLKYFCESPDFIKTGVGIQYDSKKLFMDTGLSLYNVIDLSLIARSVDNERWKGQYKLPLGLARLTEAYHSQTLPKGKTSRSNWETVLNDQQMSYAANDAHCAFTVLQVLRQKLDLMEKKPNPRCFTFNCVRGELLHVPPLAPLPWGPENPDYDPGPPPPPRPPKQPFVSNSTNNSGGNSSTAADGHSSPSVPRQRDYPRTHNRQRSRGRGDGRAYGRGRGQSHGHGHSVNRQEQPENDHSYSYSRGFRSNDSYRERQGSSHADSQLSQPNPGNELEGEPGGVFRGHRRRHFGNRNYNPRNRGSTIPPDQ